MRVRSIAAAVTLSLPLSVLLSTGVALPAPKPEPVPSRVEAVATTEVTAAGAAEPEALPPAAVEDAVAQGVAESRPTATAPGGDTGEAVELVRDVPQLEDVTALSEPLRLPDGDVHVIGVSWAASSGADATVEVRTRADGADWGEWEPVDVMPPQEEDPAPGARVSTESYVAVGADEVQTRITTPDGRQPRDARTDLITPGDSRADAGVGQRPANSADAAAVQPTVLSRAQWGFSPYCGSVRHDPHPGYGTVKAAIVHHTAGSNNYTAEQVPSILRGIWAHHVCSNGWDDIGYNMLVDKYGRLWEGRAGGLDLPVIGAHALAHNAESFGISLLGSYEGSAAPQPSAAAVAAITKAVAWKLQLHGVDPTSRTTVSGTSMRAVSGHRDAHRTENGQVIGTLTSCPGSNLYAKLPSIAVNAKALQGQMSRVRRSTDVTADGYPDLLTRTGPSSAVTLRPGIMVPVRPGQPAGAGWNVFDVVTSAGGDFTGDGRTDILARERGTGRLRVYLGNGTGGFSGVLYRGAGWQVMSHVVGSPDVTGDGRPDILSVDGRTGELLVYRGDGRGWVTGTPTRMAGFGAIRELVAPGDFDGDGRSDVVVVASDGALRILSGNGDGTFGPGRTIGLGWQVFTEVLGAGDVDGDGSTDLQARESAGRMRTYFGDGHAGFPRTVVWGAGWDVFSHVLTPGDFTGNDTADVVAIKGDGDLLRYDGFGARDFTVAGAFPLGGTPVDLVATVGDVDNDGGADVVSRRADTGALQLSLVDGAGRVSAPRQIGTGWQVMKFVVGAGDFSGDGVPDIVAVDSSNRAWLYPMTRGGGFRTTGTFRIDIGGMPSNADMVVAPGAWDAGTRADLLVRRADGALLLYSGTGPGDLASPRVVGWGWGIFSMVAAAGDVTGDGRDDLVAVEAKSGDARIYQPDGNGGFGPTLPSTQLPAGTTR
jgi:hypothetical protein